MQGAVQAATPNDLMLPTAAAALANPTGRASAR